MIVKLSCWLLQPVLILLQVIEKVESICGLGILCYTLLLSTWYSVIILLLSFTLRGWKPLTGGTNYISEFPPLQARRLHLQLLQTAALAQLHCAGKTASGQSCIGLSLGACAPGKESWASRPEN